MTNVIPFTPRGNADGGWSAAERARLAELAERLSAAEGIKVDAVYGVTDEGDPWCVIKDENEEILVHVARIDGQFVIHDAAADAIQEGDSLWTACDRLLGEAWRDSREEVVVPLSHRQAQSVIALALAVAFIHEVQDAEAAIEPLPDAPPVEAAAAVTLAALVAAAPAAADQPRQELLAPQEPGAGAPAGRPAEPEQQALTPEHALDAPEDAPAPVEPDQAPEPLALAAATTPAPEEAEPVTLIQGTAGGDTIQGGDGRDEIHGMAGDDSLNGDAGADRLYGGEGADTLDGGDAGFFEVDLLDGGAGDDQLILTGATAATGGEGGDTFVITGRPAADGSGLLGVIIDFLAAEGDRLVFANGNPFKQVGETSVVNLPNVPGFGTESTVTNQGFTGRQVWVDTDGDGIADGHLLLGNRPPNAHMGSHDATNAAGEATELPPGYMLLG